MLDILPRYLLVFVGFKPARRRLVQHCWWLYVIFFVVVNTSMKSVYRLLNFAASFVEHPAVDYYPFASEMCQFHRRGRCALSIIPICKMRSCLSPLLLSVYVSLSRPPSALPLPLVLALFIKLNRLRRWFDMLVILNLWSLRRNKLNQVFTCNHLSIYRAVHFAEFEQFIFFFKFTYPEFSDSCFRRVLRHDRVSARLSCLFLLLREAYGIYTCSFMPGFTDINTAKPWACCA